MRNHAVRVLVAAAWLTAGTLTVAGAADDVLISREGVDGKGSGQASVAPAAASAGKGAGAAAAAKADGPTQLRWGLALLEGEGCKVNEADGARWVQLSAQQGHAPAQALLGRLYLEGRGLAKDYFQAVKWLRAAAAAGYRGAEIDLGMMFFNGTGVHRDYVEAYVLLNGNSPTILGAPPDQYAAARKALAELPAKLSDDQKADAERRILEGRDEAIAAMMKKKPLEPGQKAPLDPPAAKGPQ